MRALHLSAGALVSCAGLAGAQTIYDNGPLSTGATLSNGTDAPAGYVWSEVQNPNTSLGFAALRFAEDATLASAAQLQSIDVYAYVTNANASTSPFTSGTLRIWDGPPNNAASNIVFGNTTTNRFVSATPLAIYRCHWQTVETNKFVWRIRLAAGVTLPAGSYWFDWGLNTGSFVPVTLTGQLQKPGSNAMIFTTDVGFWRNVQDGGTITPQDLAFTLNGTGGGGGGGSTCYPNCDHSTTLPFLNVADFSCFLSKYAAADAGANCDNSTTPPVLNVADFSCFLAKYASGCSAP